jgi:hypothetical protein
MDTHNKNLIIGAFSNYKYTDILSYLNSIDKNVPQNTDKIMLVYNVDNTTKEYLQSKGWMIYSGTLNGHIHMQRFRDMWYILQNTNYDYIISTDVRDVIFQHNPFEYLSTISKPVLVASENITYKEEAWNTKNIHEGYGEIYWDWIKDKEVGNVGILGGKGEYIKSLFHLIWLGSQAGDTQHFTDQSAANLIIHNELIKPMVEIDTKFCLQVGSMADKNAEIDYKNYPLIHQYDRSEYLTKELAHFFTVF